MLFISRERVECADGFSMSVQASEGHYCSPRNNGAIAYESVEIGFPSAAEPLLAEYAEEPDKPTETVYGWVPADIVKAVIAKHGGQVSGQLPHLWSTQDRESDNPTQWR